MESAQALIEKAKELLKTEEERKAYAAILGAAVADASAARCHWQYDANAIAQVVGEKDPAFWSGAHVNPFYTVVQGANTCYGDQLVCVIESLSATTDMSDLRTRFRKRFGESDDYLGAIEAKRLYNYGDDQVARTAPISGPWIHGTIEKFLANQVSETDNSADALLRAIPVAAVLRKEAQNLIKAVDLAVVLTQRSSLARNHSEVLALALADVITGNRREPYDAFLAAALSEEETTDRTESCATTIRHALDASSESYPESVQKLRATLPGYAEAQPAKLLA